MKYKAFRNIVLNFRLLVLIIQYYRKTVFNSAEKIPAQRDGTRLEFRYEKYVVPNPRIS